MTVVVGPEPLNPFRIRLRPLHPVAQWTACYLLPVMAVLAICGDVVLALNWILTDPADLQSASYDVARHWLTMREWGIILLCYSIATFAVLSHYKRCWLGAYFIGFVGGGYWFGWAIVSAISAAGAGDGASYYHALTQTGLMLWHFVVGMAWPVRNRELPHRRLVKPSEG